MYFKQIRCILLAAVAVPAAFGTDYYVSPTGNDGLNGKATTSAWQTIAKVNRTNFIAGDRILFQGGSTFSGNLYLDNYDAGTPSAPVTVSSYGSGQAIINAGSGNGVFIYNTGGIRISNIRVVGSGYPSNQNTGILFYMEVGGNVKLDTVQVDSVDVSGFGKYGITIMSWNQKSGFKNISITNSVSHDNADGGINVSGYWDPNSSGYSHQNLYIGHCTAYNNYGVAGTSHSSGNGISISDVNGATIERSVAYNNGTNNTANGGPVGIVACDANADTIQYNEAHHNHTNSVTDGGGFDLDGGVTNSTLQYNYAHDNDGPGLLFCEFSGARAFYNNTIRYNISQNDGRKNAAAGIHLWNGGSGINNSEVYNNTVYITPGARNNAAINLGSPTANTHLRNNLFMGMNGSWGVWIEPGQSGLSIMGNAYWSGGSTLMIGLNYQYFYSVPSFRSGTGMEMNGGTPVGINADPRLTNIGGGWTLNSGDALASMNAYAPLAGSPLIDAGLNLANFGVNPGTSDFYGAPALQGAAYDIGAVAK